jgi:hypothetical protein
MPVAASALCIRRPQQSAITTTRVVCHTELITNVSANPSIIRMAHPVFESEPSSEPEIDYPPAARRSERVTRDPSADSDQS